MTHFPESDEAWATTRPEYEADWPLQALKTPYAFSLLGRFCARVDGGQLPQLQGRRLQQLVAYLLLHRDRPHRRDALAASLWPASDPAQARKNLRQSLWLLQRMPPRDSCFPQLLLADKEWVRVNPADVWVDVAEIEAAFLRVCDLCVEDLTEDDAAEIKAAVDIYKGDLLEGWSEPWYAGERGRLRAMHRSLLDKLIAFCEACGRIDTGLAYCELSLRHDRASERAHWRMMRLYRLAGDRTAALRQFERCAKALEGELGVAPSRVTVELYDQICSSG